MIDGKTRIEVVNNSASKVGYLSESFRIRRIWTKPNERKMIPYEELEDVMYAPGGLKILRDYLLIKDPEARMMLGLPNDEEYLLEDKHIRKVLYDMEKYVLRQVLEVAPEGVKSKFVNIAIEEKLDSIDKLDIIKELTGKDVAFAIKEGLLEGKKNEDAIPGGRKLGIINNENKEDSNEITTVDEGTKPKYNIVSRESEK